MIIVIKRATVFLGKRGKILKKFRVWGYHVLS